MFEFSVVVDQLQLGDNQATDEVAGNSKSVFLGFVYVREVASFAFDTAIDNHAAATWVAAAVDIHVGGIPGVPLTSRAVVPEDSLDKASIRVAFFVVAYFGFAFVASYNNLVAYSESVVASS